MADMGLGRVPVWTTGATSGAGVVVVVAVALTLTLALVLKSDGDGTFPVLTRATRYGSSWWCWRWCWRDYSYGLKHIWMMSAEERERVRGCCV